MSFIQNIGIVAKYEAKTLRRSWFFRLFSIGALVIFTFLNIGLFSPLGGDSWELISIPSSIPIINLHLINIGQSIVVIFLAADFLKRDKKLDTNEVLYTRSISNFEYIIGKTWGILRLFLGLDILILAIGLLMNIISKSMSIDFMSYISYLFIICVPTILFSLGLAFVLMSVIRNQAITFLILLGIAAIDMFYLWFSFGSVFDYMAFGIPVFKSGIIGFDNLSIILNQRLLYIFMGLALVLTTVLLFKRLPQSSFFLKLTYICLFIFLAGAAVCAYNTFSVYRSEINDKSRVIEINRQFENKNFATMTDAKIELIHKEESFEASADIKIINANKEPLNQYLFSLNPSLNVLNVTSAGKDLSFKRTNHILEIDPGKILNPGDIDSVFIHYEGAINESFCYPNYIDNIKENPYRIAMVNVAKRQAFLKKNYVLLTPDSHWYPVPALNYYPSNPARIKVDFTNYILRVKTENGLMAVSQGRQEIDNEYSVFKSNTPFTGLTLSIGDYKLDSLRVDSILYLSYYFPGNDYYKKDLAELKDTLSYLVSGIMRDLETSFSTKYPFKTLSLIEVPIQFYSYPKNSTQTRAEVQPAMVLLPEKLSTIDNAGFNKQFTRQKKRNARNNQIVTDNELKIRLFNNFIRNTFISGEKFRYVNDVAWNEPARYLLGPSFYFFKNNFYSSEYPVINAVFESHLQQIYQHGAREGFQSEIGRLSDIDKANLILKEISFKDLLVKNPQADTIRNVLTLKGDYFFNLLRSKAGMADFNQWFFKYIDDNRFKAVDILQFDKDTKDIFGFNFYTYLDDWYNSKEQPGFIITNVQASEIIVQERTRYQVTFIASNPEPVAGLFNVAFRTGGIGSGSQQMNRNTGQRAGAGEFSISRQGRGMEASDISKIVLIGPGEAKKIGIVLDAEPRSILINTLFSKNIPGEISIPIREITKNKSEEFSGEEVLPSMPIFNDPSEIIVDNEDPGFSTSNLSIESPLKRILGLETKFGNQYSQIRTWNIPEYWQPVVQTSYFGKYIRSSVYTRPGTGERTITWTAIIREPGYYDVYCYIGKTIDRLRIRGGAAGNPERSGAPRDEQERESNFKDMHYKIYNDEGVEEITLDYENAEGGWNNLGRYYFSADTAKVVMTNQSTGKMVIGDAVKWVKQK